MNKKRFVALMAAATMLLNVTPVMAAENATGSATTTSSGTVSAYDNTPKYKVTLPTSNALAFTVDPYGLLKIASGGSAKIDELSNSGEIATASGAGALIKNESSVPVTVSMKLYAEDSSNSITFMADGENVVTGSGTNMFLALIPSADKAGDVDSYTASSYAIPVTATSAAATADAKFKLDKAEYEVVENSGKYSIQLVSGASNYDATVFKVGGLANPGGDWSPFIASGSASTLSLGVVFEYEKADDDVVVDDTKAYGYVSGSATAITDKLGSAGGGAYTKTFDGTNGVSFILPDPVPENLLCIYIDGTEYNNPMLKGKFTFDPETCELVLTAGYLSGVKEEARFLVKYADRDDVTLTVKVK